jgi:hypothetical protein
MREMRCELARSGSRSSFEAGDQTPRGAGRVGGAERGGLQFPHEGIPFAQGQRLDGVVESELGAEEEQGEGVVVHDTSCVFTRVPALRDPHEWCG